MTTLTKQKKHTVKKGETLSKLSKSYGLPDWKPVWEDADNSKLAKTRKKPDFIQPGDVVVFNPPGPDPKEIKQAETDVDAMVKGLETKRAALEKAKKDLTTSRDRDLAEINGAYKQITKVADTVDAVATVTTILVSLGSAAKTGQSMTKLSGDALKKANDQFMKDAVKAKAVGIAELGATVVAQTKPKDSDAMNALTATASAYGKMTSPSFWA